MQTIKPTWLALGVCGVMTLGCSDGGSGDSPATSGTMNLAITDAAVDSAARVVVQFDGVEVKPVDGEKITFEFDEARQIDLLALEGNASESLLTGETVPAGEYAWIRLMVSGEPMVTDSFIETDDGAQHALFIPSGAQTGLKLVSGFTVPAGGSADFTVDFDLRKSVVKPGQSGMDYILKPALRLVDNSAAGSLTGTVDSATASAEGCMPAAYVYSGSGVTPDDEGSDNPPLTSARITMDEETGDYMFTVGFLGEGDYTVAWTCDAGGDDPEVDDELTFEATAQASVTADGTAEVSFE